MEPTSKLAYDNMQKSGQIASWHDRIMEAMVRLRYATKSMIAKELGSSEEQVHKRLSELQNAGKLLKTELRLKSPSTGQIQSIWALSDLNSIVIPIK